MYEKYFFSPVSNLKRQLMWYWENNILSQLLEEGKWFRKKYFQMVSQSLPHCMMFSMYQYLHIMTKASQTGKVVKFTKWFCYSLDRNHKIVVKATKVGSLYQIDHKPKHERVNFAKQPEIKEDVWHKCFGHLGVSSLQKLANKNLVDGFDFNLSKDLTFCEACSQGQQHCNKFTPSCRRADELLELVHTDVCGKMNEYF